MGFLGGSDSKESACNAGYLGLIPRSQRFPGEGNDYPLQCSCLENPMDRGVWRATVATPWIATVARQNPMDRGVWRATVAIHGVAKSRTQLSN